ncbi:MAG: DUF4271 domain-containing protein [Paludibacteraceae bacterium]|nr:DUF4271 domain-containing protein [Paludibacteraceae bacterium]
MSTSIPLISSPISEPWTAWILLLLLLLAGMANVLQPGMVVNSFTTIFTKPERQYTDAPRTALGQICLQLFQLGTLGMAYYLFCFQTGDFSIARYGVILIVTGAVYATKVLMMLLVDYTFQLRKKCATIGIHYANLLCVFCCALYPILLLMHQYGATKTLQVILLLLTVFFIVLVTVKYCRAYLIKPMALVYILLFVLTVDVLPLLAAYFGTEYILSQSFVQL